MGRSALEKIHQSEVAHILNGQQRPESGLDFLTCAEFAASSGDCLTCSDAEFGRDSLICAEFANQIESNGQVGA